MAAQAPRNRVVKQAVLDASSDLGRVLGVLAVVAVISSILGVHVWNQYRMTHLGYEISRVTSEHRRLLEEHKKLSIEVAVQGRTERMSEVARERFGLQPVAPSQVHSLQLPSEFPEPQANPREVALGI